MTFYPPQAKRERDYMTQYYCIVPEIGVPICGFSTRDSALRYKVDHGAEGIVKLFDTRTMQYSDAF